MTKEMAASTREPRASELAYNDLLERIINLRLPPGSLINEQAMANELGLGRMPVREAIARLATDRFITVVPRRGAVVSPVGLDDVLNMFEAREAIECGVAYIVATRATKEDLDILRELVKDADGAREGNDHEAFLRDDHAIHAFLVHMVRNSLLQDAADRLLLHNLRFWRMYWGSRPAQTSTMMSHSDLVAALEAHDPDRAAKAMREHLSASLSLVQASF
jgi:DNA-binding GntR family transcriptional regulator